MIIDTARRARVLESFRRPPAEVPPTIAEVRAGFAALMAQVPIPDVPVLPRRLGGRPALSVEPADAVDGAVLLYLHGGGFVSGSPETALGLTARLAIGARVRALSVDYRLAPEHPFPAGLEDALAAYRELLRTGTAPDAIVIAGDSAGGNLALATCLAARDQGLPLPAGVAVFSPATDLTRSGESIRTKNGIDPFFTPEGLQASTRRYLAGHDPADGLASPALADLAGFPPVLLQVGTAELLLDDATRFAERAWKAEVDVILDVVAGAPHVFPSMTHLLPEAEQATERAALFIRQRLAPERLAPERPAPERPAREPEGADAGAARG